MKSYKFQIKSYYIEYFNPIRTKQDIILLLINCIKYITSVKLADLAHQAEDELALEVHIDKMKRLLIKSENSIHTFHFPFHLSEAEGKLSVWYKEYELDSKVTTILKSIFSRDCTFRLSTDETFDMHFEVMREFGVNDLPTINMYWEMMMYMIEFEPGYVRYDYDLERSSGKIHPINHLDINYSRESTFKIGLKTTLTCTQLLDILDTNTNCKFIK